MSTSTANTEPRFPSTVKSAAVEILPADTTDLQTLVTAGDDGCEITMMGATSTDSADKDLLLYLNDGADDYAFGRITIPDGAGTNGTDKPVNLLDVSELPQLYSVAGGDAKIRLETGWSLKVGAQAAVTADKLIHVFAGWGDF